MHLKLRKLFRIFFLVNIFTLGIASFSSAEPKCDIRLLRNGTSLFVSSLPESFWLDSGALRKVRDGLALNIERKVKLLDQEGNFVKDFSGRCTLAYDLWAETYLLSDTSYQPTLNLKFSKSQAKDALLQCVGLQISDFRNKSLKTLTLINPIDKEQESRTREWLATKGIGGAGSGVVSRALGAVIDLKTESVVKYDCIP